MKMKLTNVGAIKNLTLDLSKQMIILCGPNNTGKTYAAYSVYSLRLFFSSSKMLPESFLHFFSAGNLTKHIDITTYYQEHFEDYIDWLNQHYPEFFRTVFGENSAKFTNATAEILLPKEDFLVRIVEGKTDFFMKIDEVFNRIAHKAPGTGVLQFAVPNTLADEQTLRLIQSHVQIIFLKNFLKNYIIFPTERTAITIFSKELSLKRNYLVDKMLEFRDRGGLENPLEWLEKRATRYTLPVSDNLAIAEDSVQLQKTTSKFAFLADDIETMLGGSLDLSKDGEMQFKPKRSKEKLGLHLSGSMVKSLSSLVFYFRHRAEENDSIIIDEPEMNLHPDNQRKIARILAKAANSGLQVIVSTHSDYFIREINNCIMLSHPAFEGKDSKHEYGFEDNMVLKPETVGAYFFSSKGESYSLPMEENGFEVETIDNEIIALNEESNAIYHTLLMAESEP